MLPDPEPDALPQVNHRTLILVILAIGVVGCAAELTATTMIVPRFVLFVGVIGFGLGYAIRRLRKRQRSRFVPFL